MITPHQVKYFAHELTKRNSSGSVEKFASTLMDAQVDLNPHQVDAALFAFRSPLSKGALLADEVGLGKTIEAGIVIAQKWAERKRKILVIVPANLRKQWSQELQDKFFIPSTILETKSFNENIKRQHFNPFEQNAVVICSYQFARAKETYVEAVAWDMVVIDEAHRLRNVYKPDNKIGKAIKSALKDRPKILLTATPLQNNISELFGLIGLIDDQVFGDIKSFRDQFGRRAGNEDNQAFAELRLRLQPVCKRTLRRQAQEYINYTKRTALVEEFYPSEAERQLYDLVSEYLGRDELVALPKSQRMLMTLILRKLLASSTYAIAGTLAALEKRLQDGLDEHYSEKVAEDLSENYEGYFEDEDEFEEENRSSGIDERIKDTTRAVIEKELADLRRFRELADSIQRNSKGEKLLTALEHGFSAATRNGASRKAVIFTESTRTQEYIRTILEDNGFAGKLVLFNGSNNDIESKNICKAWLEKHKGTDMISGSPTADKRAALVECFRDKAEILIATEAAAEGINLQFCSLVINYDLPWNPQRIEQRIGRCHRYGQRHDVVVVNFLNKANAADQRVYELLNEKFQLFDGVFGSSDEVLGAIESGVDFEKRIASIYQNCRREDEISAAFDALQTELEEKIGQALKQTRQALLENFDDEVISKLRLSKIDGEKALDKFEKMLWQLTKYALQDHALFQDEYRSFELLPTYAPDCAAGKYTLNKNAEQAYIYRIGNQLAQSIIQRAKTQTLDSAEVVFEYDKYDGKITVLEELRGQSGILTCNKLTYESLETEDFIVLNAVCDNGAALDQEICSQLMRIPAQVIKEAAVLDVQRLEAVWQKTREDLISGADERNMNYFDEEIGKLDKWAEDVKKSLELELKQLDVEIGVKRAEAKKILVLKEKIAAQKEVAAMEKRRNTLRYDLYSEQDKVDSEKNRLIDEIAAKLDNKVVEEKLFTIRWTIV